jgi:glucokinase
MYIFEMSPGPVRSHKEVASKVYPSQLYPSMAKIIHTFLREHPSFPPRVTCLAVAGPIRDGTAEITNLAWSFSAESLEREVLEIERVKKGGLESAIAISAANISIINDFTGIALGLPELSSDDYLTQQKGNHIPNAPMAVIGAGTGLGVGYLTHNGQEYDAWASEGGHQDFTPRNALEMELILFLRHRISHHSWTNQGWKSPNLCMKLPGHCGDALEPADEVKELLECTCPPNQAIVTPEQHANQRRKQSRLRVSMERVVSGTGLPHIYDFLRSQHPEVKHLIMI